MVTDQDIQYAFDTQNARMRDEDMARQQAQIQALRAQKMPQFGTPGGAAVGALGNLASVIMGRMKDSRLTKDRMANTAAWQEQVRRLLGQPQASAAPTGGGVSLPKPIALDMPY